MTKQFYVVDFPTRTREIFETEDEARKFAEANKETGITIYLSNVNHSYPEISGEWNYEDLADTFNDIKKIA